MLLFQERYLDVFEEAQEFEKIIALYEADSKMEQPTARSNLYRILAKSCAGTGDFDRAEAYCHQAENLNQGVINEIEKADIWHQIYAGRKQYDKALEMLDRVIMLNENKQDADTKVKIPLKKIEILSLTGRFEEAIELYRSVYQANDSIRNVEFNAQLDELRTIYEVDKLEKENEIITIEKRRNRNYFLFASGGCVLLTIALGIWIYHSRTVVRKNRGLYRQIKEQDRLAEKIEEVRNEYEKLIQSIKSDGVEDETALLSASMRQRELVVRLHHYLLRDRNFTNPGVIDSHELAANVLSNKTTLHEAIKAVTGKTMQEYVQYLRLEEAKRMLEDNIFHTIEEIVEECGFKSRSTLYRLFGERYNISPGEYRKMTTARR